MHQSIVKRKLQAGELVLVPKVGFLDPNIVEIVGLLGFDCIWICTEHKAIDPFTLENMVRAARAAGVDCLIRTPRRAFEALGPCLGIGASGLMIPHVRSADDAREIVQRAKYPPLGDRQFEFVNADADFGLMPMKEYLAAANDQTFLVVQVEDPAAIEQVDEIAAVPGVDVVYVGVGDLSLSMGLPGEPKHPRVIAALERVARACRRAGITCGTAALDPEHCKRLMDLGIRYFTERSDWRILVNGFRGVVDLYGSLGFSFERRR